MPVSHDGRHGSGLRKHCSSAAAIIVTFVTGFWLAATTSSCPHIALLAGGKSSRAASENAALAQHYEAVLWNMTLRVRTAESALHRLQRLQAAEQVSRAQLKAQGKEESQTEADDGETAAAEVGDSENDVEDAGDDASEEEEDDKKTKEEKEQGEQIKFNAATNKYLRWRQDYQCGQRVPFLPDESLVECNPAGKEPCCSTNGWCGSKAEHCSCPGCADHRIVSTPKASYLAVPGNGICSDEAVSAKRRKVTMKGLSCSAIQDVCALDPTCIAYSCSTESDMAILHNVDGQQDANKISKGVCDAPLCSVGQPPNGQPLSLENAVCYKKQVAYNIKVSGGTSTEGTFLSSDGSHLDLVVSDVNTGWQRWVISKGEGDWYYIKALGSILSGRTFLSTTADGNTVDLFHSDDGSGRQRWVISGSGSDWYNIRPNGGTDEGKTYLSTANDGSRMELAAFDDGSGRQRWLIPGWSLSSA